MVKNKSLIFEKVPQGYPVPGQDILIKEVDTDIENAPEGGIVTKNLYVSFDPYQRGRMRSPDVKSYSAPFQLGGIIDNGGVAEVVKSANPDFKEGDIIYTRVGTQQYSVLKKEELGQARKIHNPHNLPLSHFTGILGMSGLTAYSSLYKIGEPKKGETIFVSAASGAVGAVVGQLAKREGLKVIGSVGSDEKVEYIKSLGFDEAFNYKKVNPHDALAKLAPDGIDIYYDNVGGIQLEAAIQHANNWARFVECGMISYYNTKPEDQYKPSNLMMIVGKRLKLQGFIVGDPGFGPDYAKEHQENVMKWLANGEFKVQEHVTEGIDNAAEGLVGMLKGENFGKAVLKINHD